MRYTSFNGMIAWLQKKEKPILLHKIKASLNRGSHPIKKMEGASCSDKILNTTASTLTLSKPVLEKDAWSTLKLLMNSCSKFVLYFTFFKVTAPVNIEQWSSRNISKGEAGEYRTITLFGDLNMTNKNNTGIGKNKMQHLD